MTAAGVGQNWLGVPVAPIRTFGVFCEDPDDELQRRQEYINRLYGVDFRDLGAIRWVSRLGEDNIMMRFDSYGRAELTPFFYQCLGEAKDHGANLFLMDTVADTFGGNHNDPGQVRQFVQHAAGKIAREIGAALLTAHPSRSGQQSGDGGGYSQQWDAAFRSRLYFASEDKHDHNARTLTRKKSNYAARDEKLDLHWQDGVFVPIKQPTGILGTIERRTCERVFLDLLDKTTAEGQHLSSNSRAGNYAPRIFAQRPEREKFARPDFERAMQTRIRQMGRYNTI
jgi:RecA-family ATPase